ncbi:YolD-like family protein [Staphylococcus chromogenes]|uniref:YolD-like family protein n=2 Tax=Staphylococcus chromogenes TaxID=46126 RepID=UPI000D1AA23E|nr:YolD-like family protein [Staphylococcus chromogenes]MCE4965419.1 YolD-like family protein [Staphylococcus chromogenes]PTF74983.1 YolD-like family protein [Staphylococcus chromogenes]PTG51156.1 YolD-like family protein [Staphylococcus chromogenes]QDW92055.1 YolD-like family protein [Staphylococcus chromogenes]RIM06879.1 YolD-like family protein [Staphylococcus chromogenes]
MMDRTLPPEYQAETDYRKIPRQYLNTRIPMGRGIVKWAPFATLPEQFERIQQFEANQLKIDRPDLSEDQMIEINHMLHFKISKNEVAKISYWRSGHIHTIEGYIASINTLNNELVITNERQKDYLSIALNELYAIE